MNKEQEKILKSDAKQLATDLNSREKIVVRRPKELRFGGVHPAKNTADRKVHPTSNPQSDQQLRRLLGI